MVCINRFALFTKECANLRGNVQMKKSFFKIAFFVFGGMIFATNLFASTDVNFVNSELYKNLKNERFLQETYYKPSTTVLKIVPHTNLSSFIENFWSKEQGMPSYTAESLYLLSKKDLNSANPESVTIDKVSEIFRSVSSMKGILYFSHKQNKTTALYKEAYCVSAENSKTRIPDDTSGSAEGKIMYCMQNDNSFGKMYYKLSYHQNAEEVCANFVTTNPIYIGPVKAISSGNLKISLLCTDCGEDIMVYLLVQSKFPSISMFEERMNESFVARLDAIYNWFVSQF